MPQDEIADEIAELLELEPDVVKELADEWVREQ